MAIRKSIELLPGVFRTDVNEKFLSATIDQLISEPALKNLYGYIGRKFAPTYKNSDSYVIEDSLDRQYYQLEPSTIIKDASGEITFFSSYIDLLNKIKYYGGLTEDHSRLFASEYYSFDPKISFDKLINFGQYYWLPNGPTSVQVNTSGIELTKTYTVARNVSSARYDFTTGGAKNNTIVLARGGSYTFTVDQSSEFWIQSELGTDGVLTATPSISSRNVLGVENNGATVGDVVFNVPQKDAQDRFIKMTTVYNVDYATPIKFSDLQNQYLSDFLINFPQYQGIIGQLNGKTTIFQGQNQSINLGEEVWTVGGTNTTIALGYPKDSVVPNDKRFGIWQIQLLDVTRPGGIADKLLNLFWVQDVTLDEKVYIRYGIKFANTEWYKEFDGFFHQVPLLTSLQDTLYIQDGLRPDIYSIIKIVDQTNFVIDVDNDILGQLTYTSPNGVEFTSGLKIKFDVGVTPTSYRDREYYVENVGDSINLVDIELLVRPEPYNDELAVNYPIRQIVLDTPTNAVIPAGSNITFGNVVITNNIEITAGATKITTLDSTNSITKGLEVTGVGISSGTLVYDVYADTLFPEYITIKRDAKDLNAWSRNNRWFHVDVIKNTAIYNNEQLVLDQQLRAQRPIVQFEGDLQLFNYGRIGKNAIDILDTDVTNPLRDLQGKTISDSNITFVPQGSISGAEPAKVFWKSIELGTTLTVSFIGSYALGVEMFDGMRVIFGAAEDPLVKNKIYILNLVQYQVDSNGLPTGPYHISLNVADDGESLVYDSVVVKLGNYKGSAWWYDGTNWNEGQQKTSLQQDPLFDVHDNDGKSLSDLTVYPRSNFVGTKLFGYEQNTLGVDDKILGFPLTYRSFTSQGDILFKNYFNTDTFTYVIDQTFITKNISVGFLKNITDRDNLASRNTWRTVNEYSKQYQLISYTFDGGNNPFMLDIAPNEIVTINQVDSIPYLKVYQNKTFLTSNQWTFTTATKKLTLLTTLTQGDIIDIEIYSDQISAMGYYEIPLNLDLNAQNVDLTSLTLGQMRNHLITMSRNSSTLIGNILGPNNLRDIEIKQQGGSILQHSAPVPLAELFLLDGQSNFIPALEYAQREYTKFKNKFLELSISLPGIDPTNPQTSVDKIITEINKNKNTSFPWFYSDMVPYGTLRNTINYTVYDPLISSYEITNIFSISDLSNKSILVYLNNIQLIVGSDYSFDTTRPAITFNTDNITLNVDDSITIVEFANTDGCYIPETPTKVGTWAKFIPEIVSDNTYRTPINIIRGHDGSITPAFNDYRDNFLLELEKRIYNNIKGENTGTYPDIYTIIPGKFRKSSYLYSDLWKILSSSFLTWVGNNKVDYSTNTTFESSDSFTWNYSGFVDRLSGEKLQGSWRACFQYFYDTFYPHTRPWEMLGFTAIPNWWESFYGPGPYTGGNKLLWDDLEAGLIRNGPRANLDAGLGLGIDPRYVRPGLSQVIPVDENGILLSPAAVIARATSPKSAATSWAIGELGPVEMAWRNSSDFPFAIQKAIALATPARYFGQYVDTYRIKYNYEVNQYLTLDNHHVKQTDINFNGDTSTGLIYRASGYLNWIADYLISLGIAPGTMITPMLRNYQVNLAYKLAGFSDKKYLQILAEQSSPTSTNASILIPDDNYNVLLFKSAPIDKIVYSAVIVEKSTNGYVVKGYNINQPYFTIIPSVPNSNGYKITVLNSSGVVYKEYQNVKLTVPYGYEFKNKQQIVDFLISYERYLLSQGFTFNDRDSDLGEERNWKLSVKEFLFWAQQGWKTGSILVLSPVVNSISAITSNSIVDEVTDSQQGSKVVDQNFNLVRKTGYKTMRTPSSFKVTLLEDTTMLAFVELNLVQYEHVLVFDNVTVFNDVIYKPELGNRQYRLKLIGQKTDNWDGSLFAPGFIYNSKTIQSWQAGKDYLKGELVLYKNFYYVALQNIAAEIEFNFAYWRQLSSNEIKTGLLRNFSTIAVGSQSSYDSYGIIKDNNQLSYSHGLIGFKPRQYLSDLGLSETTQIELYKGYIKQKGSMNAVNALTKAEFNNVSSDINLFEEWAVRTGEYGALDSNPYIEIVLDEKAFSVNPAIAEFVSQADNNRGDGLTVFNKAQLYKSTDAFNGNISLIRDTHSNYDNDILTAGYVNIDDVSTTIYDIKDYINLNTQLADIGRGYTIWCAKDLTGNWNVYRVTETNNHITTLTNNTDGTLTWVSEYPHTLLETNVFLIKGFSVEFDGFYQVDTVISLDTVIVSYLGPIGNLDGITTESGYGILYKLDSMRFRFMEDSRVYGLLNPPHGWKVGDKIWIDDDAATNAVQGQPYTTGDNLWKVYEKQQPWNYDQTLLKASSEYSANVSGFGTSVKLSYDGLLAITGSPYANCYPYYSKDIEVTTGIVNTFDKNTLGRFIEGTSLIPDAGNAIITTREFGYSVDQAINIVGVGAPGSFGNIGLVYVYNRDPATTTFNKPQVLWSGNVNATNDRFGSRIAFDQHGTWLYVGAPGNDRVYVYGLNNHVIKKSHTEFVIDNIRMPISSSIRANIGDTLSLPETGAVTIVRETSISSANILVNNRTNITAGKWVYKYDSVTGVTANTGSYVTAEPYYASITSNITLSFTPQIANNASMLGIVGSFADVGARTFIPDLDYTVVNNKVVFTANIAEGVYQIDQQPRYTLHATLQGDTGTQFGYALDSSLDGAQLAVGAPGANVFVNDTWLQGAGAVYVYDRVIEANITTGATEYITSGNIDLAHRVTVENVEVNDYEVVPYVTLYLSGNLTTSVGDHITQPSTGANLEVVVGGTNVNSVVLRYLSDRITLGSGNISVNGTVTELYSPVRKQVYFSSNIVANVGEYITQTVGSVTSNAVVVANSVGNTVTISYANIANAFVLTSLSNISIGGTFLDKYTPAQRTVYFTSNVTANVGQFITQVTNGNNIANANVISRPGTIVFSGNINPVNLVTIGDTITQVTTGANAVVTKVTSVTGSNTLVEVDFITSTNFTSGSGNVTVNGTLATLPSSYKQIYFNGNITANVGQYIRQSISNANATVVANSYGNTVTIIYNSSSVFTIASGNVTVGNLTANVNANVYPTTSANIVYGIYPIWANVVPNAVTVTYKDANVFVLTGNIFTPPANVINVGGTMVANLGVQVYFSNVITANVGQTISEYLGSGNYANATVISGNNFSSTLSVSYITAYTFDSSANIKIDNIDANVTVNLTGNIGVYPSTSSNIGVYPTQIANIGIYPTTSSSTDSYAIRFTNPPPAGKVIYIETNQFNLLEKLIGIDSLTGGLGAIQSNAAFGTDLTICSNNCAIYIGAPYYDNGPTYNSGAVWKFHNRGRLYGTNNGYTVNPVFMPGDSIRLDNFEIIVSGRMMPQESNYILTLTKGANITANAGNYITQTVSGANVIVVNDAENTNSIVVSDYHRKVTFNSSISLSLGDIISQGNATVQVIETTVSTTTVNVRPITGTFTTSPNNVNVTWKANNETTGGSVYPTAINIYSFTFGSGDITVTGNANVATTYTSVNPMASLDSLIKDINDAELLGISAINENNTLRLNTNKTVAKNLLRVLTGTNTAGSEGVYADAGLIVFAYMQIIVNPFNASGEYFGNKVVLAQNAYMLVIGSERGTTKSYATFDIGSTILDQRTTAFFDKISGSGSVYIYELYDDPRNAVEDPGRYSFAQQLNTGDFLKQIGGDLNPGDRFGAAIDIIGSDVIISAPSDSTTKTKAGSVYIFRNPTMTRGWKLIRYQQPKVDIGSISRLYLYDNVNNKIQSNLEFIDPAKGVILGQADQDITYKTEYDPAVYNRGINSNSEYYWGENQINQVWWNLDKVRFIDYEQDTLTYRSINWGRLFPGSVIEVCEWVESTVLPSEYVISGKYDGIPKYPNNTHYVEIVRVDPITNIVGSLYYFWVTNKTTVPVNDAKRNLPIQTIADYISNPKSQDIAYAAVTRNNAIIVYNVAKYLSAKTTVLHIDYDINKDKNVIHSEYELLQKANPFSLISEKISNKLIDSLSGIDQIGRVVPDPSLSVADRYGINTRPRQSIFIDRLRALSDLVTYVNSVLIKKPIARQYSLNTLQAEEAAPSLKLNEYDLKIDTEVDLEYIDTTPLATGYRVLVNMDSRQDNLWVLYELAIDKTWEITKIQSYKTSLFWEYVDWYADGFGPNTKLDYVVDTLVDAKKLPVAVGEEILVRVSTSDLGGWNLITVNINLEFQVVGIQNGTIQLKSSIWDFANNGIGFWNQGFDTSRFDQNPTIETRYIIEALKKDIFINELQGEFNSLFFVMVNYLFTEQKYVDWIFKTSFVSITHYLRALTQPANYIKDNITYYENYIEEIKPYVTKIREYLTNYNGDDTFGGDITDFDLAPYYDPDTEIFRSPSGELISKDQQLWATGYLTSTGSLINIDYKNWYKNRNFFVDSIVITNPGVGYISAPTITILGGGTNIYATASATINSITGGLARIDLLTSGSGYYLTPTVIINGGITSNVTVVGTAISTGYVFSVDTINGLMIGMTANAVFDADSYITSIDSGNLKITMSTGNIGAFINQTISFGGRSATAYAMLNNEQVRTFDSTLKFDRVSYGTTVLPWSANTSYTANTIVAYDGVGYKVKSNTTTANNFIYADYTIYAANSFSNANDRIMSYYKPTAKMPVVDVIEVELNTANAAIDSKTIYVFPADFVTLGMYISGSGVTAGYITAIKPNVAIVLDDVTTVCTQIKLSANVTLPTQNMTIKATYNSMYQLVDGTIFPGLPLTGPNFSISPNYGVGFDNTIFDPVEFNKDGSVLLDKSAYDTVHYSVYQSQYLGLNPEDIILGGGAYIDTYHSHAPEELVPGIVFDTLDMRVYTKIDEVGGVTPSLGFRIFDNMINEPSYLRIGSANATVLTQTLGLTDGNIYVADASTLTAPDVIRNKPGVVFIDAERITYWTIDLVTNTLGRIRRGTQGTAAIVHGAGVSVIDSSATQLIPSISYGNLISNICVWYTHGVSTILDGTGFNGSTTTAAGFLKASPAFYGNIVIGSGSSPVTTEDAINIDTEDGNNIYTET